MGGGLEWAVSKREKKKQSERNKLSTVHFTSFTVNERKREVEFKPDPGSRAELAIVERSTSSSSLQSHSVTHACYSV